MKKVKVGLVGLGGFGKSHIENLAVYHKQGLVELTAACDNRLDLNQRNVLNHGFTNTRFYDDFEAFLKTERELDLVIIATPIPLHKEMSCRAMQEGYNVLLEKPPAVTVQDIDAMLQAQKITGKTCIVGFQNTSMKSFLELKKKIQLDKIGDIETISALGIWKRNYGYFTRAPWVGKLKYNGNYVLDGTINNPFAHLLNNCLVLSGLQGEAAPDWVKAELYRSNNIESEDNSCLHVKTKGGVDIFFYATICARVDKTPYITIDGTKGSLIWDYAGNIIYKDKAGTIVEQSSQPSNSSQDHMERVIQYLKGELKQNPCPLEETRNFVLATNLAFESSKGSHCIPREYIHLFNDEENEIEQLVTVEDFTHIKEIETMITSAANSKVLFSEAGVPWAVQTEPFNAEGYEAFRLFDK